MKSLAFNKTSILLIISVIVMAVIGLLYISTISSRKIRNVLLISIDTCRADYLSCYGFKQNTTPNVDALASEGILFENALAPLPYTLPAHCSMLTGTTPQYHGVLDNSLYQLADNNVTLAERLKEKGFLTTAFISSFTLDPIFGIDQGFDVYDTDFEDERNPIGINERMAGDTTALAIKWLEKNKKKKSFLFVHYYDPHYTYNPPEPFASRFRFANTAISKAFFGYAGEIAYTDHCIGLLIQKLKELGLYDSTLIVVTADHGEGLGDHKEPTHGYYIYQSTMHVPLVFKIPGGPQGIRIKSRVGLVDIVPTICSLLGVEIKEPVQGKDLTAYYRSDVPVYPGRHLDCLSLGPTKYKANSLLAVVTDRYKYIQTTRPELYDLEKDPYEKTNIIDLESHRAGIMQDRLRQIIEETPSVSAQNSKVEMDTETLKRLESLGYIGSVVDESFEFDQSKEDPKDIIDYHVLNSTIDVSLLGKDYDNAKKQCLKMISMRPDISLAYAKMAKVLVNTEDYNEAAKYLTKCIELDPEGVYSYINIANLFIQTDEFDKAIEYALKALGVKPDFAEAYYLLNAAYIEKGRYDLVRKNLTDELISNKAYHKAFTCIADKFLETKQIRLAHEYYLISIKLEPDSEYLLNALGWLQAASAIEGIRNPKQAVKYALKACKFSESKKPEVLDTLALAYAANGQFKRSIETAQKAVKIANSEKKAELAGRIQARLELYKAGKTYLDPGLN